jgi:hypothetical protein
MANASKSKDRCCAESGIALEPIFTELKTENHEQDPEAHSMAPKC